MSRAPLRTLLALALPMVLARASQSVVTFADAIQVKHLGKGAHGPRPRDSSSRGSCSRRLHG